MQVANILVDIGPYHVTHFVYILFRTLQSLRSLLYGMLTLNDLPHSPLITTRRKTEETLYPQADGPCQALSNRREYLFGKDFLSRTVPEYDHFEAKTKSVLGHSESSVIPWLTVKEILTCHYSHNLPLPPGLTSDDIDKATYITGYMWGVLYKDEELNRLAIGRFIEELLEDVHMGEKGQNYEGHKRSDGRQAVAPDANVLIYSGHDWTLVPLLCALSIYDGK